MKAGGVGYDKRLPQWIATLAPVCARRGTRLIANALQSALFAVVWKYIEAELNGSHR